MMGGLACHVSLLVILGRPAASSPFFAPGLAPDTFSICFFPLPGCTVASPMWRWSGQWDPSISRMDWAGRWWCRCGVLLRVGPPPPVAHIGPGRPGLPFCLLLCLLGAGPCLLWLQLPSNCCVQWSHSSAARVLNHSPIARPTPSPPAPQYTSDLDSGDEFWTDANGREMIRRIRCCCEVQSSRRTEHPAGSLRLASLLQASGRWRCWGRLDRGCPSCCEQRLLIWLHFDIAE